MEGLRTQRSPCEYGIRLPVLIAGFLWHLMVRRKEKDSPLLRACSICIRVRTASMTRASTPSFAPLARDLSECGLCYPPGIIIWSTSSYQYQSVGRYPPRHISLTTASLL